MKKITRRKFLATSGFAAANILSGPSFLSLRNNFRADKLQRPNIIFILTDQLRYQSCGYAGDDKAITPNIDNLAKEGANFFNTVSSMPVCAAYRASLLTGKYTTSTGMVINELRMNTNHKSLAHCLSDVGYETGYIGKWHLYANELGHHHETRNAYIPPGEHRLGFDNYWAAFNFHHEYYDSYYYNNSPRKIYYGENIYEPDAQTDQAIEYLKEMSNKENPFFLFLSLGTPHSPYTKENVPENFYNKFKDVEFPMPPNYRQENDPYGDKWSNAKKSPALVTDWMKTYYAMTSNIDWNVGRLLNAIKKQGIQEDTIIIFTSDHGEMFGAHGRMKKNIFYEEAARVPFLIRWPEKIPPGIKTDCCFTNVDIMPTLLSLANVPIPREVEGMDLSHCALGREGPEPQAAFLQNTGSVAIWEDGYEWRALRDKRYTYAVYRVDKNELLFDNLNDPYQLKNLAQDPQYRIQTNKFRSILKEKMASINDTFEKSTWYRDNWMKDRTIIRTATMN